MLNVKEDVLDLVRFGKSDENTDPAVQLIDGSESFDDRAILLDSGSRAQAGLSSIARSGHDS